MRLDIRPYIGAGPLRFGMTRQEVQATLASTPRAFKRTPDAASETDAFEADGIYVEYDKDGKCEAIEMASPAVPLLKGHVLVGLPFQELLEWFRNEDPAVEVEDSGLTSALFGVGLYAPAATKEPGEPVEAAIVFRRGYYDLL